MADYSSTRVSWQGDEQVKRNIAEYGRRVQDKAREFALSWVPRLETHAKKNAPWTDRTANARQALRAYLDEDVPETFNAEDAVEYPSPEQIADIIVIVLSHGMEYGEKLENSWAGAYSIIGPTLEALLPEMKREFQAMFK